MDEDTWNAFVTNALPRMRGIAVSYGVPYYDADEVVLRSLYSFSTDIHHIKRNENPSGYLTKTIQRDSFEWFRTESRERAMPFSDLRYLDPHNEDTEFPEELVVDPVMLPEDHAVIKDEATRTLARIPSQMREIFQLKADGYTLPELAERYRTKRVTIKSQINRLRNKLREEGEIPIPKEPNIDEGKIIKLHRTGRYTIVLLARMYKIKPKRVRELVKRKMA